MNLYNIKVPAEKVDFQQAVLQGLGQQQGLFFPEQLPDFSAQIDELLALPFATRSARILSAVIGEEFPAGDLAARINTAFDFPLPLTSVSERVQALELFHGPTLAFKDFGARFMAQCLSRFAGDRRVTILTATSGDTGAAVAQAFHGLDNIQVTVLYPQGKISPLQEKLFCTLGDNIHTLAVNGTFDDCQALVKQAFDDQPLKEQVGLNSANSINISRLLAQVCYYFEALAQQPTATRPQTVISVPSGNFGNLTAGLLAQAMGLPVRRFIVATNANDTVPRYLQSGEWSPHTTIPTLSNAMDVSAPNNWPRIEELARRQGWPLTALGYGVRSDEQTQQAMRALHQQGYISEPHGAVAWSVLDEQLAADEYGIFLCTAHPAKFKESVEQTLNIDVELPPALAAVVDKPLLSQYIDNDYSQMKQHLLALYKD